MMDQIKKNIEKFKEKKDVIHFPAFLKGFSDLNWIFLLLVML